jgi:hypothetical protein
MLTDDTLRDMNRNTARLPLTDARVPHVALELVQLSAAAEAVRARLDFDAEPAAFAALLEQLAP